MEAGTIPAPGDERRSIRWLRQLQSTPWVPVYVAIVVLFIASRWMVGASFATLHNFWSIAVLGSFVAVVGAGQGLVILTGGIDLSVPWVITLGGIMTTRLTQGDNTPLVWVLPLTLAVGVAVGVVNGLGVVALRISPVIFTIAMNAIIEGVVLVVTGGTPKGSAPPALRQLMHSDLPGGVPVIVPALVLFAVVVGVLMSQTVAGKRAYAVGNGDLVSRLSGVRVGAVLIGVYAFSGLTAVLTGVLLTGYASQSYLGMGDDYLLPSIAAVVLGGASIIGGRGHYTGTLGGAILLSLLTSVLTSLSISEAAREIIFGGLILLAVLTVRERAHGG